MTKAQSWLFLGGGISLTVAVAVLFGVAIYRPWDVTTKPKPIIIITNQDQDSWFDPRWEPRYGVIAPGSATMAGWQPHLQHS